MRRALVFGLFALLSCDHRNEKGFVLSAASGQPVAVAPEDFEVLTDSLGVALDGSRSYDPAGGALTYLWEQIAGTASVVLSGEDSDTAVFDAPAGANVLTFRLTITGPLGVDSDAVTVTVKSTRVTAPDTWFVGYGNSGTITPVVEGVPGATFEWSGLPEWMPWSVNAATGVLTYGPTPRLQDFQSFFDLADVGVLRRSSEGRLQLKVTLKDGGGIPLDDDWVNFSVGPFASSVMGENVPVGEPVFLNGGAKEAVGWFPVTSWSWSGTKPDGSPISFLKPDKRAINNPPADQYSQRLVYFVPDRVGTYKIVLNQNSGGALKGFTITCGRFSGIGDQTAVAPDTIGGQCAGCHGGGLNWVADLHTDWLKTAHASAYSRLLDPTNPLWAPSQAKGTWRDAFDFGSDLSIEQRTLGWSAITVGTNDGWTQIAADEGYVFNGTTWPELKRKYPKTKNQSNVQCESCHGPGSEHVGNTTRVRISYDSSMCGRCHSDQQGLWEGTGHRIQNEEVEFHNGKPICNGCHTTQGFISEMHAQDGADPYSVLIVDQNTARPEYTAVERKPTTCQACHEPHKNTARRTATGADPQLRAFGNVKLRNDDVVNAGDSAICFICHQSCKDARSGSEDFNSRRAPHFSPAAEMLLGVNGQHFDGWTYGVTPHGTALVPTKTERRYCLTCHADVQPAAGTTGYGALGGHSFRVTQGTGGRLADNTTHTGAFISVGSGPSYPEFSVTAGPTFMKLIQSGDTVTLNDGPLVGTYVVRRAESEYHFSLAVLVFGGPFSGSVTNWSVNRDPISTGSGNGTTLAGTKKFSATSGDFLARVFPGDRLTISSGLDADTYTITAVDTGRQLSVDRNFVNGTSGVNWSIASIRKYNTAACEQCHPAGFPSDFRVTAGGDYDGDGSTEAIQDEVAGLMFRLQAAINSKLGTLVGGVYLPIRLVDSPYRLPSRCSVCHDVSAINDTRVVFTDGFNSWTFPGPAVPNGENPFMQWGTMDDTLKQEWEAMYKAAYNLYFVFHDNSLGLHNPAYAVNLLQSSIRALDPGATFDPF